MKANKIFERPYVEVLLNNTLRRKALIDSGAEVCCIGENVCNSLDLPREGKVVVRGLEPEGKEVDGVWVKLTPALDDVRYKIIAPTVKVWCAVIPGLVEDLLLTPDVVKILKETKRYEMPNPVTEELQETEGIIVVEDGKVQQGTRVGSYDKKVNTSVDDKKVQQGTWVGSYDKRVNGLVDGNEVQKGTFVGSYDKEVNVLVDDNRVQRGRLIDSYDDGANEVTVKVELVNVSVDSNEINWGMVVDGHEVNAIVDDEEVTVEAERVRGTEVNIRGDDNEVYQGMVEVQTNDVRETGNTVEGNGVAERVTMINEQAGCPSLKKCWVYARSGKKNFMIEDGILYHKEVVLGHKVKQLCLPISRINTILELGHDAPFAGHMEFKSTKYRIALSFWFPEMTEKIKQYCQSCTICQLRAPVRTANRVPITPIDRNDELPFTHLVMDCIGPMITDSGGTKPEYNYALVVVDVFTRWPMAYPLKSISAKATCEILLQIFTTYSVPKVISSDCGTNFTSQLTQGMLKKMGCSPRFNTPGHPEASGVVERCNRTLKTMIYKLAWEQPRSWHRVLPYVLWSLRERPSSTTHVSPYTLLYGTLPRGPLSVIKESWGGEQELPLNVGKRPEEYLKTLRNNLELAQSYAEYYSEKEQQQYAHHYNLRSNERHFQVGDMVVMLIPTPLRNKWCNQWQGPGVVTKVKSPYSYEVEIKGRKHHVHANRLCKFNQRIEEAVVNSCAILREQETDFGRLETYESKVDDKVMLDFKNAEGLKHLAYKEKEDIAALMKEYAKIFTPKVGLYPRIQHRIRVDQEFKPKRLRAYKVPELLRGEVRRQLEDMLEHGIITPSTSEMASPVVCIMKKTGGVRLAIDYRYVNKHSTGDGFPTPDVRDILQKVGKAKFISSFDARSGYWQIPMEEKSQWLTAFACDEGLFEFKRMPFGLKSASITFTRAMGELTHGIHEFTEAYIDDIAVFSMTWQEHLQHLRIFFNTVTHSGLTFNLEKCRLAEAKINFLGHVVGSGTIGVDPTKLQVLDSIRPPTTKKEVRKIIGFFNYFQCFIPNLAKTLDNVTELTKNKAANRVRWTPDHQNSLDRVIQQLKTVTTLNTIDYAKDFGLITDASDHTVGCCLVQRDDNGYEKPIAFASRKLSDTQRRWATIEREAYAIIWALQKYRPWICMSTIQVYTDHNPLTYLTETTPKSSKLMRWALALQEYDLQFSYRAGNRNVADFLSRLQGDEETEATSI